MDELQAVTTASEPPVSRKLHAIGRRLGTPVSGTFELTAGCNFNCRMCYIHDGGAKDPQAGELTAAQWLSIGKEAADAGTVFLLLTGGEPLLRRDFAEIYTGLKKLGMMISVNTNGSLITGDTAALFEKNPPMRLNISLYADTPEGYRRQCGADAYENVVSNIRRMKAAGVQIKLNVSFTEYNADRFREIAALVRELDLHCQTSVYMYPPVRRTSPTAAQGRLSPEAAAKQRVQWDLMCGKTPTPESAEELRKLLLVSECDDGNAPGEGVRCRAGHTAYWIDTKGQMMMCGMVPLPVGSVPEEGFLSCWQKTRALMQTVRMPKKCTNCSLRPYCCVCPAACFAETGDFSTAPAYLCEMSSCIEQELLRLNKGEKAIEAE